MTDVLTKQQRSYNMSMIRGKWTKQEILVHNFLKGNKIKHIMHPEITGKPDILINGTAVFLDGCFWHKCPKCFKAPLTDKKKWTAKIKKNVIRDQKVNRMLRKNGYKIIRIWEHELKSKLSNKLLYLRMQSV